MNWVRPLSADLEDTADVIGGKASGLVTLLRLGLPVPPGLVVTTEACRVFLATERFPDGLADELAAAELAAGMVSVRSGAALSMPGMMTTILNVAPEEVAGAVAAVFSSWHTPRARTYRELHGVPHDLGTAVVVQAMVFGDRDERSGSGVAFSRDPGTGAPVPFGELLFGHQGDDVVSGSSVTVPLDELAGREPLVWADLLDALHRVETHYRDACYLEFTFESGKLWLLQARPGRFTGRAAVRVAVDLADDRTISRAEAVRRVSQRDLDDARVPRVAAAEILARGTGSSPGVATGRVATTTEAAVRMAGEGPVILVRPETSPLDMNGLAVAAGVLTARGGPASHAAVVARAMRKPAVVGLTGITFDGKDIRVGGRTLPEGTIITIDGTGGEVAAGSPPVVTADGDPHLRRLVEWRLPT